MLFHKRNQLLLFAVGSFPLSDRSLDLDCEVDPTVSPHQMGNYILEMVLWLSLELLKHFGHLGNVKTALVNVSRAMNCSTTNAFFVNAKRSIRNGIV